MTPPTAAEAADVEAAFEITPAGIEIKKISTSTNARYELDLSLSVGDIRYIDRGYRFIAPLPAAIVGLPYIRTANGDRNAAAKTNDLLSFTVDQPVVVYVADADRTVRPAWLKGWTDTGLELHDDYKPGNAYSLFSKSFPKGRITLGSNYWGDGGNMYSVFIAKANAATGGADAQAPTAPGTLRAVATSSSEVRLVWTASTDNVAVTGYAVYRDSVEVGHAKTPAFTDTTVAAGHSYRYQVAAYDGAGNRSARSTAATASTPAAPGTVALQVANVKVATGRAYTIDPSLAAGDVRYIDRSYHFIAPLPSAIVGHPFLRTANADRNANARSANLLSFDVNQDVVVYVADADRTTRPAWLKGWTDTGLDLHDDYKSGNRYSLFSRKFAKGTITLGSNYWGDGGNMYSVFIVPAGGASNGGAQADTQAPSVPAGLQVKAATASAVDLSWQAATDNVGVTGYRVYRNASVVGQTPRTTFTDTAVAANAVFGYKVTALDAAGNESAPSQLVLATPGQTPQGPSGLLAAFPGAEGFGAVALAACRSKPVEVLEVTNLNDAGRGSLRQALADARNDRFSVIVFRVAGYIDLRSRIMAQDRKCLYVAGQTAPGDGITIRGPQGIRLYGKSEDVVMRHLRFRLGIVGSSSIGLYVSEGRRIMLDHLSSSWATNKLIAISAVAPDSVVDISLQRSLLAEALAAHPTALQITGVPRGSPPNDRISIQRNLLESNSHRNPQLGTRNVQFVNNVVYNWHQGATQTGGPYNLTHADLVGNFYRIGPMTDSRFTFAVNVDCGTVPGRVSIYLEGNVGPHNKNASANSYDQWTGSRVAACYYNTGASFGSVVPSILSVARHSRLSQPKAFRPVELSSFAAERDVISDVGDNARLACDGGWIQRQDAVDARLLAQYAAGKGAGRPPQSERDVGGYPSLSAGRACPDADRNGLPDAWEQRFPNATQPGGDADGDGYLNIEEFLNGTIPG